MLDGANGSRGTAIDEPSVRERDRALAGTLSPTLATTFLGCRQATAWELARRDPTLRPSSWTALADPDDPDELSALVLKRGHEHEAGVLAALREAHGAGVAVIAEGTPDPARRDRDTEATRAAMDRGVPFIHQAAFGNGGLFGYADFLRRVEIPCASWAWSYEPWDAKLTRTPKPSHLLQLCLYADMLDVLQGGAPRSIGLMLGMGSDTNASAIGLPGEGTAYRGLAFPLDEFRHYTARVRRRLIGFVAGLPDETLSGEPCGACAQCRWTDRCGAAWEAADHPCRTAGITGQQVRRLAEAGVGTQAALAALTEGGTVREWARENHVRVAGHTLERLASQAALQRRSLALGEGPDAPAPPACEILPPALGRGLARLPMPDAGDVWFDFEGDPLEPGGLEYLNGVMVRAAALEDGTSEGFAPVPGRPELAFRAFWAHDQAAEVAALQEFMDWLGAHLARHPSAHLYHYAPYERTALRRMASKHATREAEVDDLLRTERMVDLYRVVAEGVRVGVESYSIKKLEPLYMPARQSDTKAGGDSVAVYHHWRDTGEDALLADIEHYNRDDCVSTVLLHEWLLARAAEVGIEPGAAVETEPEGEDGRERREAREATETELDALRERIMAGVPDDDPDWRARRLAADLVDFHRREAKPEWWAFFDRQEWEQHEHVEDYECVGAMKAVDQGWGTADKRSALYTFRFPEQLTKMANGATPVQAHDGAGAGEIVAFDRTARTLTLKRGPSKGEPLPSLSLIPGGPIDTSTLAARVRMASEDFAGGGEAYPHIAALLRRAAPRLAGRTSGAPIVPEGLNDPAGRLAATIEAMRALDRSWLAIQGPPGAGKTFTLGHAIAALIEDGRTVGVLSNSHKAVDNVIRSVEARWAKREDRGAPWRGRAFKKDSRGEFAFDGMGTVTQSVGGMGDVPGDAVLVGGTAWAFAHDDCPTLDILVVDEAGQVSLGNLIAAATSARSMVLVGDQMQLAQPLQGAHPRESGMSCLEYMLEEHAVVPPERGVFLGTTFRMHPELCRFVSDAVYAGELRSDPSCAVQRLVPGEGAHAALKPHGLSFLEVPHEGCAQESEEEAEIVAALLDDLLASRVVACDGTERAMALADVLVVAPYNVQVNRLIERLPAGARVGTVDKFQGQEAEAVIVSMTSSDAGHMPRDASFLLSRNRLNVAVSRARCLAIVVASPGLLDLDVRSVEEMRLANLLCWAESVGRVA